MRLKNWKPGARYDGWDGNNDKDLKALFTAETVVHMPLVGTFMTDTDVCNNVVLTCDQWQEYNLMKEENSLTPEQLTTYLGKDLLPTVGAAELPLKQLIETALEETKEVIEKENKAMYSIRIRLVKADENQLTEEMKKNALELRYTMSRKRPTDDEIRACKTKGRLKARLVAKDLKCIHKLPEEQAYAPVPELSAFRLLMAAFDAEVDRVSTTDVDTAHLQVPNSSTKILGKIRCPWTGQWIYVDIMGVVYVMQIGWQKWLEEVKGTLTSKPFNMKEIENNNSVYINAEKGIAVCCWVDDPVIICKTEETATWFHAQISAKYDAKGINRLTPSNPVYCCRASRASDEFIKFILENQHCSH